MKSPKSIPPDELIVFGTLLGLAGWCLRAYFLPGYYIGQVTYACQVSGYSALGFLATSLLFGPLLRVGSWFNIRVGWQFSARLARNTGISSALLALGHTAIVLTTYLKGNWYEVLTWPSYLHSGLLAVIIMILLLIASVKPLMSAAKWQLWKPTFRLSMAAAVLVLHHMLYAPNASVRWTLGIYGVGLAIFMLRFIPMRPAAEPARQLEAQPAGHGKV
jgi:DMSO/TMAO reductase YedYZ heme-binding membrane subunit